MERKHLILLIIGLAVISTILYGCVNQKWKVDSEITKSLDNCDEEQKYIDMAIIPECYLSTFKEHGWSESKVKEYIQYRLGINIDDVVKEEGAWQDAWLKYYSFSKSNMSIEEFNIIQKEYQEMYSVTGFISELDTKCYCPKDVECSICPTMPYLILTDYQVEFHGGLMYTVEDLTEKEMYVLLMDVDDISGLELDGKYVMNVRFVEDNRIYLVAYERI